MSYQKYEATEWKDEPNEETYIDAEKLNNIENGIKNLEQYVLANGGGIGGDSEPIGTVKAYAGSTTPDGYLMCDGRQVSKTEYGELFAVLGTAFNLSSDTDSTKFRIPDLRGRVIVGVGSFDTAHSFTLAKTDGEYEHKLTLKELPSHTHNNIYVSGMKVSVNSPGNNSSIFNIDASSIGGTGSGTSNLLYTSSVGDSQSHNNMQPYLALHYIIKAVKTTPLMAEVENSLKSRSTKNAPSIDAVTRIEEFQLDMTNTKCGTLYVNNLRLQNRLVIFDFEAILENPQNGYNLIGKVPTEILPITNGYYSDILMYFSVIISGMNRIAFARILKNGNVEVYSDTNTSSQTGYIPANSYIRIHESWFIN